MEVARCVSIATGPSLLHLLDPTPTNTGSNSTRAGGGRLQGSNPGSSRHRRRAQPEQHPRQQDRQQHRGCCGGGGGGANTQPGCGEAFLREQGPLRALARQLGASMAATARQMQVASSPRSFESIEVLPAVHDSGCTAAGSVQLLIPQCGAATAHFDEA